MRKLVVATFVTLDGVMQAPGRPDEDPEGGFAHGGWQVPYVDEHLMRTIGAGLPQIGALLLGRRTYEIFAAVWPRVADDNPIAATLNRVPKYVASRGTPVLDWEGTSQLGADVIAEVEALRERHREIHVYGSLDFAQTLFRAQLFDVLNLWVFPVVLGEGKKVFPAGSAPAALRLLEPAVTASTGAVLLRYAPAGEPRTGDIAG